MINQLDYFKSQENLSIGDTLQSTKIIKEILLKIKDIIENHGEYNEKIEKLSKELLSRAIILDLLFNGILEESSDDYQENYYYTPIIGVFYNGTPLLLNGNYLKALGAGNIEEIKKDIITNVALEKYYEEESFILAKNAVLKLKNGQGYKNLILKTKSGKTISWNSFGKKNGFEIRIGNDITHGIFSKNEDIGNLNNENLEFKTKKIIQEYIFEVKKIIHLELKEDMYLIAFSILSEILDEIWNNGQYLMNITIDESEKPNFPMICNNNYLNALGLTYEELITKIQNGTLFKDHYSKNTQRLITGLLKLLKEDGYYFCDFNMIDKNKKSKTYAWFRKLIIDKDLKIDRTFGIGNNAISKGYAEIIKFLES